MVFLKIRSNLNRNLGFDFQLEPIFEAHVGAEGARVWIKSEHLGEDPKPPEIYKS